MLTEQDILRRLESAAIAVDALRVKVESRRGRAVVSLDDDRVAWFPENHEGSIAIANERRILRVIEKYCGFRAPRILYEDPEGWDVRAIVPGVAATDFLTQIKTDPSAAQLTGAALGRILADQHTRIPAFELNSWLTLVPPWPPTSAFQDLPKVVDDTALLARIDRALERRHELQVVDPVLTHCDLGPWNIAVSPTTGVVQGVFDYGDAAFGDRHQDFKYMQFQRPGEQVVLNAAIESYETAAGITLDRERIRFLNAIDAIGFLGFRFGHPPEEAWCGRTLAEDIEWTESALEAVGL